MARTNENLTFMTMASEEQGMAIWLNAKKPDYTGGFTIPWLIL